MLESNTFATLMRLETIGDDQFLAAAAPDKGQRLFGGQLLAQCLSAAQMTVDDERTVNSLHAYFMRPGDSNLSLNIHVERVRDGRAFSSRQISASQRGKELFRMSASLQIPETSLGYASAQMPDVPTPDDTPTDYTTFTIAEVNDPNWHGQHRPIDIRYINPPTAARGEAIVEDQLMWIKVRNQLNDSATLHLAGLAYISDATVIDHVMLPHGLRWHDDNFNGASLDHSMWFHAATRADEWLLFQQHVEATGGGRGLASGRFFDRAGKLIATCVQEGLMRWSNESN